MARKARDYKAEERRRNELAKARGFTSRAAQRRAIEKGAAPALAPTRLRKPSVIAAQRARSAPPKDRAPIKDSLQGYPLPSREQRARDWSALFAGTEMAQYRPERAKELGVTKKQYTDAYLRAFVQGDSAYHRVRYYGGSEDLRYWFVELNDYFEAEEYDEKYGPES